MKIEEFKVMQHKGKNRVYALTLKKLAMSEASENSKARRLLKTRNTELYKENIALKTIVEAQRQAILQGRKIITDQTSFIDEMRVEIKDLKVEKSPKWLQMMRLKRQVLKYKKLSVEI